MSTNYDEECSAASCSLSDSPRREECGTNIALSFSKSTEPKPVTGSQPVTAVYPSLQQREAVALHLLLPDLISFAKDPFDLYNDGLMKPTAGRPCFNRNALINDIMPATTYVKIINNTYNYSYYNYFNYERQKYFNSI